ncbi:hypothetical protein SKAU_G00228960 [Synaphobranchus kaupii]|uniref:Uncharacterized protein n=1 Tax=Synaphobranchus kaupii TaxID=118154 RepID=A0A9Q1F5G5_SYNKA|nr:hypothetical protein SKAU_G00228960 [Synaphobranchus kaupii]
MPFLEFLIMPSPSGKRETWSLEVRKLPGTQLKRNAAFSAGRFRASDAGRFVSRPPARSFAVAFRQGRTGVLLHEWDLTHRTAIGRPARLSLVSVRPVSRRRCSEGSSFGAAAPGDGWSVGGLAADVYPSAPPISQSIAALSRRRGRRAAGRQDSLVSTFITFRRERPRVWTAST